MAGRDRAVQPSCRWRRSAVFAALVPAARRGELLFVGGRQRRALAMQSATPPQVRPRRTTLRYAIFPGRAAASPSSAAAEGHGSMLPGARIGSSASGVPGASDPDAELHQPALGHGPRLSWTRPIVITEGPRTRWRRQSRRTAPVAVMARRRAAAAAHKRDGPNRRSPLQPTPMAGRGVTSSPRSREARGPACRTDHRTTEEFQAKKAEPLGRL